MWQGNEMVHVFMHHPVRSVCISSKTAEQILLEFCAKMEVCPRHWIRDGGLSQTVDLAFW